MNNKILIIIPALNEEKSIAKTINEIKECIGKCNIVVLDGNSDDMTRIIAIRNSASVISVPRGKGNAFQAAIKRLENQYTDSKYWVMLDADYTYPAKHIPELIEQLDSGHDVAIGYRTGISKEAMPTANRIGNIALSMIASIMYGRIVKDLCTGMWAFKREVLYTFDISSARFTLEADLFVNTVKGGYKLSQIPIEYRPRIDNSKSKLVIKDGFKIGWFLIKNRYG